MKKILQAIIASAFLLPLAVQAQSKRVPKVQVPKYNRNEVGIELGGTGLLYNLYYQQHLFRITNNTTINLRVSGEAIPFFLFGQSDPKIGYHANLMPVLLAFKKRHAWETGVALCLFDYTARNQDYILNGQPIKKDMVDRILTISPQISYRYYLKNSAFYLRGTVLVNIGLERWDNYGPQGAEPTWILPWAGVSAGITL